MKEGGETGTLRFPYLFGEVVDAHSVLCGHQEEGLGGVEGHTHHTAAVLAERVLRGKPRQLVHQHRLQAAAATAADAQSQRQTTI